MSLPSWRALILHHDPAGRSAGSSVGAHGQRDMRPPLPGTLQSLGWREKPTVGLLLSLERKDPAHGGLELTGDQKTHLVPVPLILRKYKLTGNPGKL